MNCSPAVFFLLCTVSFAEASLGFRAGRHGGRNPSTGEEERLHDAMAKTSKETSKDALRLQVANAYQGGETAKASSTAETAAKASSNTTASSNADPCACEFKAECTCENSLEFMNCVSAACATGNCDCHEHQYHNACVDMSKTCDSLEFKCSGDKAVCSAPHDGLKKDEHHTEQSTEELQKELEDLIQKKCKLEEAEKDGWLNADNRLRELKPEIDDHVDQLKARKAEVPDVNDCTPPKKEKKAPKEEKKVAVKSFAAVSSVALPLALVALAVGVQC